MSRRSDISPFYVVLHPVGTVLFCYALVRSVVLTLAAWRCGLAGDLVFTCRTEKVQPGNTAVELVVSECARLLLRWLHAQRVVEAIEVIEQPNGGQQFDDLAFVVVTAQFCPEGVIHFVRDRA